MNVWPRQEALNPCNTEPIGGNPFAVLTAIVAPAILTNASLGACLGHQQPPLAAGSTAPGWSMPTWPQPNRASNRRNGSSRWALCGYAAACFGRPFGCMVMVQETRLAMQSLAEEARIHTTRRPNATND
jgi:hypothetical protein